MSEPRYDEDTVNLGYLNKIMSNTQDDIKNAYKEVSRHYASKPNTPYNKGDTWIDGKTVYTCINARLIGMYIDSDWVTESGAKEEAENKSKTFLKQPVNYNVGDMWILQEDNDHKAGKKGEILIAVNGRKYYEANDWISQLGYGTIRSINELANNLNDALKRLKINKESGIITIFYSNIKPNNMINKDLWYVTEDTENYKEGKLYKYNETAWELITDELVMVAFEEANEPRLIEDGKIQSFYSLKQPTKNLGIGDIWTNTSNNKLYRYNGTNWVAVYDNNISEIRKDVETVTELTTEITTDLGGIKQQVSAVETKITTLGYKDEAEGITELYIENAGNPEIIRLEIDGNKAYESNLFPGLDLFPRNNIYLNKKGR